MDFVKNGSVLRLPPGFRFHPTDEELVVQYLKRKVLSYPLPASIITQVDVCNYDPWDLPGNNSEQERYFFSRREVKYANGHRSNRTTESGYWKATGLDKQIVSSKSHQLVGMKKTLVFYRGKPPKGCSSRTDWIMHEYRLVTPSLPQISAQLDNWVLCRIFLKRVNRKKKNINGEEDRNGGPVFFDFMSNDQRTRSDTNLPPSPSSSSYSGSSVITTQMSKKNESHEHEENSSCTSLTASILTRKQCP